MDSRQLSIIGAITFVELMFLEFLFFLGKPEFSLFQTSLGILISLLAFLGVFLAYRMTRQGSVEKKVWVLISLGMLFWLVADVISLQSPEISTFPAPREIAVFLGDLFLGTALFINLRYCSVILSRKGGLLESNVKSLKDAAPALYLVLAASFIAGLMLFGFLIIPLATSSLSQSQKLFFYLHLAVDFSLFIISLLLLILLVGGELEIPFILLSVAVAINGMANLGYLSSVIGVSYLPMGLLDFFYQASRAIIILSSLLFIQKLRDIEASRSKKF
ncbi:Uncharacterised protein [Candidatus Gugararchaeum adminiculabundum]|nr:Uncharacterised protein [Candidatus Gugararchaeum adminiculabundum]